MTDIYVSVTDLAEYVSRSGDLASGSYGSVSGIEGTRLHRKIFLDLSRQYGDDMETEYALTGHYEHDDLMLHVNGRADVVIDRGDLPHIIEIKSFNSTKASYERLVRPEHVAQLKLYSAMYMKKNDLAQVRITLRYVSITSLEAFEKTIVISREDANEIFDHHCEEYSIFSQNLIDYGDSMIKSVKEMTFPYDNIRAGQAEFMKNALISLTCKEALFVEAPTGTGKTISVLYPAVKGLLRHRYDKIFYLTAKTATRSVASKAINDMRRSGLLIRSILLASKESMCPYHTDCDSKYCKFAKNYYGKVKAALDDILTHDEITPELVMQLAMRYEICPHEFSLDTMNYCTVVIGDYNHAFDPRVSLVRCFGGEASSENVILIDEAHNLVDRSRDMYSASLSSSLLEELMTKFKGIDARCEALMAKLNHYYRVVDQCFATHQSAFRITEDCDEKKVLRTDGWEGMRAIPKNFYEILWKICRFMSPVLDELPQGELRQISMKFFFEARFFLTVIEQHFNDSYISSLSLEQGKIVITANCLDASDKLNEIIRDKMAAIFFSATLSPYEYYRNVLIGKDADYTRQLSLPYPFPRENLEVLIDASVSTRYKDRAVTAGQIAKTCYDELINRTGNYMIFFPSFEYMNSICDKLDKLFEKASETDNFVRKLIRQHPDMTSEEKKEYLDLFAERSDGLLLGAAVLGGHFGEGIDLVGDRLSGVIIVGVGIPKVTPLRQILSNYYGEKFGDGFAFAYRFPGWEKVLQAVGRVIRTEDDTGFALLIDDRLESPEYLSLFPPHWVV